MQFKHYLHTNLKLFTTMTRLTFNTYIQFKMFIIDCKMIKKVKRKQYNTFETEISKHFWLQVYMCLEMCVWHRRDAETSLFKFLFSFKHSTTTLYVVYLV